MKVVYKYHSGKWYWVYECHSSGPFDTLEIARENFETVAEELAQSFLAANRD